MGKWNVVHIHNGVLLTFLKGTQHVHTKDDAENTTPSEVSQMQRTKVHYTDGVPMLNEPCILGGNSPLSWCIILS